MIFVEYVNKKMSSSCTCGKWPTEVNSIINSIIRVIITL